MSQQVRNITGKLCACGRPADRWIGGDPECARCAKLEEYSYSTRSDPIKRRPKRPRQYAPCVVEPFHVALPHSVFNTQ